MAQFSKVSFWGWRFWNEDQLCGFYKLRSLLFGWQSLNSNPRLQSIRTYQHPILERIFIWTKERTWFEHLWKMSGSTFPPKLGQFIPKIAQFGRRVPWFCPIFSASSSSSTGWMFQELSSIGFLHQSQSYQYQTPIGLLLMLGFCYLFKKDDHNPSPE